MNDWNVFNYKLHLGQKGLGGGGYWWLRNQVSALNFCCLILSYKQLKRG